MELRFLSAKMDDLVDPDAGAIWEAIGRLSQSSGGNPPRAVLVHDNGKDFIQFVAKKKHGDLRNCLVQYCEYQGDGSGFSQHCSARDRTIEEAIELFQAYAAGDPEWKDKISWEPAKRTRNHRQVDRLAGFLAVAFLTFVGGAGALILNAFIGEEGDKTSDDAFGFGCVLLSVSLVCSSFLLWTRLLLVSFVDQARQIGGSLGRRRAWRGHRLRLGELRL